MFDATSYSPDFANQNQESKTGLGVQYGLMILIELAEAYDCQGCSLLYIANKYKFPIEELYPVVEQLEINSLIVRHKDDPNRLSLKEKPGRRWIYDMVRTLKGKFYFV